MSSLLFADVPGILNDTYDLIHRVIDDVRRLRRKLSNRELKQIVTDFRRGVQAINLVCIKITAKEEVNRRNNTTTNISSLERDDIAEKIDILNQELNRIVETDVMKEFLGEHPGLAEKAYMKLYGEREDALSYKDIYGDTSKGFLDWIHAMREYTTRFLSELNEAINASFQN